MSSKFSYEYGGYNAGHECPAAKIHPVQNESVRMKDGHDVERHVDKVHQPGPDADAEHVGKHTLQIDTEQTEERYEEVAKNDNQTDVKPSPLLPCKIPEGLLRKIGIPDDKILGKRYIGIKYRERKKE